MGVLQVPRTIPHCTVWDCTTVRHIRPWDKDVKVPKAFRTKMSKESSYYGLEALKRVSFKPRLKDVIP